MLEPFCAEVPVQRPDTVLLSCGTSPLGRAQSFLLEPQDFSGFIYFLILGLPLQMLFSASTSVCVRKTSRFVLLQRY